MSELSKYILAVIEEYKQAGTAYCDSAGQERIRIETPMPEGSAFITLLPRPVTSKPALDIEEKYGLQNISQRYKMPDGLTEDDLEAYLLMLVHANKRQDTSCNVLHVALAETWNILLQKNPELARLNVDKNDVDTVSDAIFGVTSAFKLEDIDFYLSLRANVMAIYEDAEYAPLFTKVGRHVDMGWIPSLETLYSIDAQVEALKIPQIQVSALSQSFPAMNDNTTPVTHRMPPAAPERKLLGNGRRSNGMNG